ncbi:MAG: hypothetical protein JW768_10835 [Chitinispirillaceae bacterium]|nr:hypothetical protein [Chitinispirillaceae bacterium]
MAKENDQELESPEAYYSSADAFFDYLRTKQGNEVISRILSIWDAHLANKKNMQDEIIGIRQRYSVRFLWFRLTILCLCIVGVSTLVFFDKFNSASAVFFTGVVAFVFGKDPNK